MHCQCDIQCKCTKTIGYSNFKQLQQELLESKTKATHKIIPILLTRKS